MMTGLPCSSTATQLLVVPRSMPMMVSLILLPPAFGPDCGLLIGLASYSRFKDESIGPLRGAVPIGAESEAQNQRLNPESNGTKETISSLCASYHKKMKKV
jgi:hypothetical protein